MKLLEYFNDGNIYVVDIDLEKFFDNVPQDKLMTLVHNLINDPDTESLIREYLNAGIMINGQLKPGYNLQIATCSELILNYKVFSNPTDVKTLISFLVDLKEKDFYLKNIVADAGYESYENYQYIENNNLIPYIKLQQYEKSKTRNFQKDLNRPENLIYNAKINALTKKDGLELKYVGYGLKKQY